VLEQVLDDGRSHPEFSDTTNIAHKGLYDYSGKPTHSIIEIALEPNEKIREIQEIQFVRRDQSAHC